MPEPATNPPSPPIEVGDGFELTIDRVATGGSVIGNGPDGRIVFVPGALPGERVAVRTVAVHRNRLEATVEEVLEASPDRVDPVCRHVADGCGGCDWQHIAADRQPALRPSPACLPAVSRLRPVPGPGAQAARTRPLSTRDGYHDIRAGGIVVAVGCRPAPRTYKPRNGHNQIIYRHTR